MGKETTTQLRTFSLEKGAYGRIAMVASILGETTPDIGAKAISDYVAPEVTSEEFKRHANAIASYWTRLASGDEIDTLEGMQRKRGYRGATRRLSVRLSPQTDGQLKVIALARFGNNLSRCVEAATDQYVGRVSKTEDFNSKRLAHIEALKSFEDDVNRLPVDDL